MDSTLEDSRPSYSIEASDSFGWFCVYGVYVSLYAFEANKLESRIASSFSTKFMMKNKIVTHKGEKPRIHCSNREQGTSSLAV